jgi:hypothetical protein
VLEKLKEVERTIADVLCEEDWNSLLVDYHHPHVWRLWRQYDEDHRVLLHKIHPCDPSEALLHPHPWPSAMRIFTPEGTSYETGTGFASPEAADAPPRGATFFLQTGSAYQMATSWGWHYVRPIGGAIYSLMVTGKPFKRPKQERFGQGQKHKSLDDAQADDLLSFFREVYPVTQ